MWRVKQTINDAENGDCLAACVSAIFEIPLEDVPNFVKKRYGEMERRDV